MKIQKQPQKRRRFFQSACWGWDKRKLVFDLRLLALIAISALPFKLVMSRLSSVASLFTLCVCLVSCSEQQEIQNTMNEFNLANGSLRATFTLPNSYRTKRGTEGLLIFRCKYPGMGPLDPDGDPQQDDLNIYITLMDRPSRIERMVAEAGSQFNPERPGQNYRVGMQGPYELYRNVTGYGKDSQQVVTTYVFKANDGELVGVEDPGSWAANYTAHRKIGVALKIQYQISKPIGQDFVKIDEVVVAFISNLRKIK